MLSVYKDYSGPAPEPTHQIGEVLFYLQSGYYLSQDRDGCLIKSNIHKMEYEIHQGIIVDIEQRYRLNDLNPASNSDKVIIDLLSKNGYETKLYPEQGEYIETCSTQGSGCGKFRSNYNFRYYKVLCEEVYVIVNTLGKTYTTAIYKSVGVVEWSMKFILQKIKPIVINISEINETFSLWRRQIIGYRETKDELFVRLENKIKLDKRYYESKRYFESENSNNFIYTLKDYAL